MIARSVLCSLFALALSACSPADKHAPGGATHAASITGSVLDAQSGEPLEGDRAAVKLGDIRQDLDHAEEAGRAVLAEFDWQQDGFKLDHAAIGGGTNRGQTHRLFQMEGLLQQ